MNTDTAPEAQRKHFLSVLKKFRTAMLVTHTAARGFHARPMAIAEMEDDGRLWFFTSANSPKAHEIELDSEVYLTAQDDNDAFLTLAGRAVLIGDRQKIAQLWREPFRVWFPEGADDPNIELIAVRPVRGEYWDNTGLSGCKYFWEATKAYVTGTTPDADDPKIHGKVQL